MNRAELLAGSSLTQSKPLVICDTECTPNFWCIGFLRVSDGKVVVLEKSARKELDCDRLRNIMLTHRIVTFNGLTYDAPMIWLAIDGASNARLKQANDQIIVGGLKYWEAEKALGVKIPWESDLIDLIEPQPNAVAGLKTLHGRLHGRRMQDLPYDPDQILTHEEMDHVISYMENDLDATFGLLVALKEPMELRAALSKEYGMNFMSKSDAQIGEGIIRKRVEQVTKEKVEKPKFVSGTTFPFRPPAYLKFKTPELQSILERLRTTEFVVQYNGKVDLPPWLEGKTITIGGSTYAMGIGGLHSTEANRAVHADEDHFLRDYDVASYYPAIILGSGLYPKALGRAFLDVYRKIREDRIAAKARVKALDALAKQRPLTPEEADERAAMKAKEGGLKIALNGVFGKLGSIWSILFAPHLMIATTLTGQLALLMLIERAEDVGISAVSGNTDGVVFRCPRHLEDVLGEITKQWERDTGFELEATPYKSLYSQSVNTYIAIKEDGKAKRKGSLANPRADKDMRAQLMKNPQMDIVSEAVVAFLANGTPIEDTIRGGSDVRDYVTVVKVTGGATWGEPITQTRNLDPWRQGGGYGETVAEIVGVKNEQYLGKVVRYYWATHGSPIIRKNGHWKTGTRGKVSKTDNCRPLMELPPDNAVPADIDYDRYIAEAREMLMDIGFDKRPEPIKPVRIYKYNAIAWFALAV